MLRTDAARRLVWMPHPSWDMGERLGRSWYYALPLNLVTPNATELLGGGAGDP